MIPVPSATPKPTGIDAKILFARFTDRIKAWYEVPENKRRFEEWQQKRREANAGRSQTVPTACCTEA